MHYYDLPMHGISVRCILLIALLIKLIDQLFPVSEPLNISNEEVNHLIKVGWVNGSKVVGNDDVGHCPKGAITG
jgi:hypothetical protein